MNLSLGPLGSTTILRRKWRWYFEAKIGGVLIPNHQVMCNCRMYDENKGMSFTITYHDPSKEILDAIYKLHPQQDSTGSIGTGTLTLLQWNGDKEEWKFDNLKIKAINYGELDFSSTDCCLDISFKSLDYTYSGYSSLTCLKSE